MQGKPIISRARLKVAQMAIGYEQIGLTPDEILQAHPHLTLAQVHDAISYYYENASELNADIQTSEHWVEELRKHYSSSVLKEKLDTA